jgi:ABC-type amino acid transport substrate-binding protein
MSIRVLATCALLFALVLSGCVPAEEDDDRIVNFDAEENLMGRIQDRGVLRIGIEADVPPWASSEIGDPEGFTVDLGQLVADSLGVDAEFVTADRSLLPAMVVDGDVDIAFPLIPTTEELLIEYGLTDPYFVAHQRLLVSAGSEIAGVDDLSGQDVCSVANNDTGVDLETLNPAIEEVVIATTAEECLDLITAGQVEAVTGPDLILLSLASQEDGFEIVGDDLTTEGYGAVVSRGTGGFDGFVDGVFAEADREFYWTELYEQWVSPVTGEPAPPFPTMNLEEAATLFPE